MPAVLTSSLFSLVCFAVTAGVQPFRVAAPMPSECSLKCIEQRMHMNDDGRNGDAVAGDGVFSLRVLNRSVPERTVSPYSRSAQRAGTF